jgi:hypothetical protein
MLGAAVIAPGYGGAAELIDKDDQLTDTSPQALIYQIKRAYYSSALLSDMRMKSLERACGYLDVSAYVEKFNALAEQVVLQG